TSPFFGPSTSTSSMDKGLLASQATAARDLIPPPCLCSLGIAVKENDKQTRFSSDPLSHSRSASIWKRLSPQTDHEATTNKEFRSKQLAIICRKRSTNCFAIISRDYSGSYSRQAAKNSA